MSETVLLQQPTPISFDNSPDESFLSPNTMNPMEMMTPSSVADEMPYILPESAATSPAPTPADTCGPETPASSDKKPTKKRKSWGQVLPQPKTNLPPRKRAKTEDEKEQRRVERVLRNRRAAQSSRERKRQEVEALEIRNKDLETRLLDMEKQNMMLMEKLKCMGFPTGGATTSSPSIDTLRDKAVTLSTELFGSQDAFPTPMVSNTVNPASLSPKPNTSTLDDVPLAEPTSETLVKEEPIAETLNVPSSPDMTQRPAVSITGRGDLSVMSGLNDLVEFDAGPLGLGPSIQDDASFGLGDSFNLSEAIDADSHLLEGSMFGSPNSSSIDDYYMVGDASETANFHFDDLFDVSNNCLTDNGSFGDFTAADRSFDPQAYDSENQVASENPDQQPLPGASSIGCDVGGLAVGVC